MVLLLCVKLDPSVSLLETKSARWPRNVVSCSCTLFEFPRYIEDDVFYIFQIFFTYETYKNSYIIL